MKPFLIKICMALIATTSLSCFMYAQHCDFKDLQARYEQDVKIKEQMLEENERLRKELAKKQQQIAPVKADKVVLAIQNNNPLNVKRVSKPWNGQKGIDQHGHVIFETPTHGVRAAASVLMAYYHNHKIDTLNGIVNRFCTAPKERKAQYAAFIGKRLKLSPERKFNVLERLPELLAAMARFESGKEWQKELFAPYSLLVAAYNKGGE